LFSYAAKNLEFADRSNSNELYLVEPRSEKLWKLPTEATQMDWKLTGFYSAAGEILENKSNPN
jgi:hypothetical protein